jgi:hypothetical protein
VQHWPRPAHLFGRSDTTLDVAECAVLHGDAAGRRRPLLDGTPYYLSSAIGWPWLNPTRDPPGVGRAVQSTAPMAAMAMAMTAGILVADCSSTS